ncbi:alpha/beta hydrolase [Hoyosella rhizosphaerae]|uniref:Alpha/beta hydrolase n=1 Tax=Hoyosella rhizosphaerae TaxID=1755582 RepID=A0A916U3J0_9ACTN|nr:alpha/beta hydrolase [Hoyosella rhizosphaerae]MBN4926867.1 alpha/beta hydrolase [Hoyosella rhizosphaerae]GGC55899.1 alpha/beta hydrolase [Hoyosella rhizosphaerae]
MTAPEWFRTALEVPVETGAVRVDGVDIAYRAWGRIGDPVVALVHGAAANAHWWDHVGPSLAQGRRVVALSLSGHGDSGRRPRYSYALWAREVAALLDGCEKPLVVAHSMGGRVAYHLAHTCPGLGGIAFIDTGFAGMPGPAARAVFADIASRPGRAYATREEAVAAFRPFGSAEPIAAYLQRHIGEHSVKPVPYGWSWKFDPEIFHALMFPHTVSGVVPVPAALLRAGRDSVVTEEVLTATRLVLPSAAAYEAIELSGHHVMLDAPLELVAWLRKTLASW